jgi:predicted ATPase
LETFVRLLRCCAQLRSPLVLFLDDLQWADSPSLRLLEALIKGDQGLPLLLIGAYRNLEVDERHALTRLIAAMTAQGVCLHMLKLGPLSLADTQALVATCLGVDPACVAELGRLVQDKTEGNPFYELQFLRSLVRDDLLHFDKDTGECRSAPAKKQDGGTNGPDVPFVCFPLAWGSDDGDHACLR